MEAPFNCRLLGLSLLLTLADFATQAIHQGCISDKNTVAERVHLIYWGLKEEIANRKIAPLQTMVDRIDHYDRLRDLRHDSSVVVTKFMLLISEHFSNRIVSYV